MKYFFITLFALVIITVIHGYPQPEDTPETLVGIDTDLTSNVDLNQNDSLTRKTRGFGGFGGYGGYRRRPYYGGGGGGGFGGAGAFAQSYASAGAFSYGGGRGKFGK